MQAGDVMSRPVVTVRGFDSIRTASVVLTEHDFTAVPVVDDDGVLIGIVTEADLIRDAIAYDPRSRVRDVRTSTQPTLVNQIMTKKVRAAAPDTDCADIAETMLKHNLRTVPAVQNGIVVGIVTRRDLMRGLARDDAVIRRNLGRFEQWPVAVRDGAVVITDPVDDPHAREVARAVALATGRSPWPNPGRPPSLRTALRRRR
ncbi:CBS domain-containing protein [Saccharopolyspora kobensis]|uniref:CBS domain-containing protein n=1 Tax=Saccharopolyspora kobensis TaxID=146035 RepID=A0A1H5V5T5_9PSEU|nr:CBS domain-containing protein [Saccharopolyspora kobensis]SEF82679.1 CBS domain-containing protein [Saccharopolyspora kobensis]SFC64928.1 CBS domain-containing protein [Saccharopolyspora kobensis]